MKFRRLFALGVVVQALVAQGIFAAVPLPPLPPLAKSPVATFREWLAMSPGEREVALAGRPEKQRAFLMERLEEYEALPVAIREERLRATDLYWYLEQLLRRAPGERTALLETAPATLRPVLTERLAVWDQVPAADRQALLQHERTIQYFASVRSPDGIPAVPWPTLPATPVFTTRTQAGLSRLAKISPADGQHLREQWSSLLNAPGSTRRALETMSEKERREMVAVLDRFRGLSPAQRQLCLDAFGKLTAMPPAERAAFLQKADRWESLSADERATWRRLITKLPPLPPRSGPPPQPVRPPPLPEPVSRRTSETAP